MSPPVAFLIVLAILTGAAVAAGEERQHPNFAGFWKLDARQSDFGPMPVPRRMADSIQQTADEIKIKRSLANDDHEANYEFSYKFDGSEVINRGRNNQTRSRAHWERDGLVVDTEVEVEGLPLKIQDKWTLQTECRCLQISRHLHSEQGDLHLRMVMVRE